MSQPSPSASLAALLTAAAALVPAAAAAADADDNANRASYRYTHYNEDALDDAPIEGARDRYVVNAHQFQLNTDISEEHRLTLAATAELMSGSSPWFSLPDENGEPAQVMSGATIKDDRRELAASWTRHANSQTPTTFSASATREDDYRASALGVEHARPLNAATTLGFGGSVSHDVIEPTDALLYNRVQHETKNSLSGFASLAWVLDKNSALQTGIQLTRHSGYLTDPYKRFYNGGQIKRESRPDERVQAAWLLRYRHAIEGTDAAIHLDYRYARDNWGLSSHTIDASWYQSLGDGWRLIPSIRWYSQSEARFYAPYFAQRRTDAYYSSDYRLSGYGAISTSLNLRKRVGSWEWSMAVDRYHSNNGLGFSGSDDGAALVSFTRFSAGIDYLFE